MEKLTKRELEVQRLIVRGKSIKQIAEQLEISVKTVGAHSTSIFTKLGVHCVNELTRVAIAQNTDSGQITLPDYVFTDISSLTPKELEVAKLISKGMLNKQIAAKLKRSIKTVEKHRYNMQHKLKKPDAKLLRTEWQACLVHILNRNGIFEPFRPYSNR